MIVIDLCQEATSPATCPACSEHRSVSPCILGTQFSDLGVFVLGLGLALETGKCISFFKSPASLGWMFTFAFEVRDVQMDTSCG